MNWKPSDKFIQVTAGLLLLTVSAFFLWQDTLKPISKGLRKEGMLSGNIKQGLLYLTGQSEQASEEALNHEKEKLHREEQALQEKLEQLRKKRESLSRSGPTESTLGTPQKEMPQKETPNNSGVLDHKPDR
jgi:hypothetical protein